MPTKKAVGETRLLFFVEELTTNHKGVSKVQGTRHKVKE